MRAHRLCLLAFGIALAGPASAEARIDEYVTSARVVRSVPIVDRDLERYPVRRCTWELAPDTLRSSRYRRHGERDRYFRRCRSVYESEVSERIRGYRVTYRYGGETFHDRVEHEPGADVRIHVKVTPLGALDLQQAQQAVTRK